MLDSGVGLDLVDLPDDARFGSRSPSPDSRGGRSRSPSPSRRTGGRNGGDHHAAPLSPTAATMRDKLNRRHSLNPKHYTGHVPKNEEVMDVLERPMRKAAVVGYSAHVHNMMDTYGACCGVRRYCYRSPPLLLPPLSWCAPLLLS